MVPGMSRISSLGTWLCVLVASSACALLPAVVRAEEASAPFARGGGEPLSVAGMLQMLTGLLLVLLLIFGAAWLVRRFGRLQGMAGDQLKVIGGLSIGQRERIMIVQAGATHLVIGVSPGGIRTLHVLDPAEIPPQDAAPDGPGGDESFFGRFNQELKKRLRS